MPASKVIHLVRNPVSRAQSAPLTTFLRPRNLPHTCTDDALLEAVKAHALGLASDLVAALLGVPLKALKYWTDSREWGTCVEYLRPELFALRHGAVNRIAQKALTQLEDRLDRGNPIIKRDGTPLLNDDGTLAYRPLSTNDLSSIASLMLDRGTTMDKALGGAAEDDAPELTRLKDALRSFVNEKRGRTIDVESPVECAPDSGAGVVAPQDDLPVIEATAAVAHSGA